nr:sulfatase-like hydrolase/transferase [Victivallales bacterium]
GKPFALYVGFYQPHAPFVALKEYYDMYAGMPYRSYRNEKFEEPHDKMIKKLQLDREIPDEKLASAVRAYYGMVSHIDNLIGKIISQVESSGLLDNTVIIYTSDHGDMLGRHRLWHKMCFYEDSVRVPLIFSFEGCKRGKTVDSNVSLLDLFPTFLEIAESEEKPELDGQSILPLLNMDAKSLPKNSVIAESIGIELGRPGRMLKKDNFKLIYYHNEKPILFDLSKDPDEHENLAESPAHKDILGEMMAEIMQSWDVNKINKTFEECRKHSCYHSAVSRLSAAEKKS